MKKIQNKIKIIKKKPNSKSKLKQMKRALKEIQSKFYERKFHNILNNPQINCEIQANLGRLLTSNWDVLASSRLRRKLFQLTKNGKKLEKNLK